MKDLGILRLTIIFLVGLGSIGVAEAIAPGWSEPIMIANISTTDGGASLIQNSSGWYWLVFKSPLPPAYEEIWIINSSDGINWSEPVNITKNASRDNDPFLIQASDGKYWVAWSSNRDGDYEIYVTNSSDGINWNAPIKVTSNTAADRYPSLVQDSGGKFWISWNTDINNICWDKWVVNSTDGYQWDTPIVVTNDALCEYGGSMINASGKYWMVWPREGDDAAIWTHISNSTDGVTWFLPPLNISIFGSGAYSKPLIKDSKDRYLMIVNIQEGGDSDIYFSVSINGAEWLSPYPISVNLSISDGSESLIQDKNGTYYLPFSSRDGGDTDIWLTHSTVTLTSPLGGEIWGGTNNISWVSISGDHDNDTFSLYYSSDGTNWTLIESGIVANNTSAYDIYADESYSWNASLLEDGKYWIKIIRTNSYTNHNETNISKNFTVDNPPASITNLTVADYDQTYINWTWENPSNADFNCTIVYINGTWQANTSDNFFNLTGLEGSTTWEISLRTVDLSGNINLTWVNQTATTLPYPPPSIISFTPSTNPSDDEGASRTFTITSDQVVNVSWQVNGTEVQTNISVTTASYTSLAIEGCWNISVIIVNVNGSDIKTWIWTVNPVVVCGDGTCEGGETCSSCPQDCGACPSVSRGTGGGGTYSTPVPLVITDEYIISTQFLLSIEAGERASLKFERTDITAIEFEASQTSIFVEVSVLKPIDPMHKPENVPNAFGSVYTYQEIKTKNLGGMESAKIKFKVNKSWVNETETDSVIKLSRYDETSETWVSLPTSKIGEDENYFLFEALAKEFSVFAIIAEEKTEEEPEPKPILAPSPTPALTAVPTPTATPTAIITPTTLPTPTPRTPAFKAFLTIFTLLILFFAKKRQNYR